MRTINSADVIRSSERQEASEYFLNRIFLMWNAWFWLLLDGGGGVGKTTLKKSFEPKAIGISNGDFFRSLNKLLTEIGLDETNPEKIFSLLPSIQVTTQLIKGKKTVVASYGEDIVRHYDPESAGPMGLRAVRSSFTDFLSARPEVVAWWEPQISRTVNQAMVEEIPVVHEGRTNRHFKQKSDNPDWQEPLEHAVLGYLYISKLELARRSEQRAIRQYEQTDKLMTLAEYVQKAVDDDWKRTVLEMARKEERLLRPAEARSRDGEYDFALNISRLNPDEAKAIIAAALMSELNNKTEASSFYLAIFDALAHKLEINPEHDPDLNQLEDEIDATVETLVAQGALEPQALAS